MAARPKGRNNMTKLGLMRAMLKSVRGCAVLILAILASATLYGYDEPVYTVTVAAGTNSLDEATVEVTQNGETTSAAFSSLTLNQGGADCSWQAQVRRRRGARLRRHLQAETRRSCVHQGDWRNRGNARVR